MTRQIGSTGPSLEAALVDAIAELAGCAPDKVDLELRAPGLDAVEGRVRFDLEVVVEQDVATDEAEPAEAEPAEAEPAEVERADVEADPSEPSVAAAPSASEDDDEAVDPAELDEEADAAADFLEGLLDAMDLPGDLRIRVKDEHAEVEVVEVGSGALIGRRGQTLEAIQELVRCALQRQFERRARVQVDVEGYRARRLEKLIEKAEEAIDAALDSGDPQRLEPMDVFERKAVHQLVAEVDGLTSRSQGREPGRRVVIEPS